MEEFWPDSDTCATGHPYLASLIGRFFNCVLKKWAKQMTTDRETEKAHRKIAKFAGSKK